ncbi:MAG: glycerophosphodiester phosphodiesterase family protein [Gemmatimonadaceae bacterium]|nr:glycerophosphodiester phosphodiesterase family protein [Gemmatimonadaceae bacterium]
MIHPVRIAHRGASGAGLAPENTLTAFERAIEIGVDAVELDVRSTRDGSLVVLHDPLLDRTTDREGPVHELTLAQVREADAGGWFGRAFAGEKVPTLAEALDLLRRRALAVIEIKADHLAEAVLRVVDDLVVADQVVIQSFSSETVRRVKAIDGAAPTALLVGNLPTSPSRMRARRMVREVLSLGANILNIWHTTLTPAFYEEVRKRGLTVWAWTVDEEVVLRDVVQMGVQGIATNHPDRLNGVLEELAREGAILVPLGRSKRLRPGRWRRRREIRRASRRRDS